MVQHVAMDRLDVQRIAAEQAAGKGVVNLRFDRAGAVEGFAETDHARVGVDAHPDDVGEFLGAQRLDRRDLHGNTPPIAGRAQRRLVAILHRSMVRARTESYVCL
ncbi:hypothetical protein ACVWW2_005446 [Bradyrhizobium sp. LM4.3]